MNDTELLASALRSRDEHIKAYLASRTDRGNTTPIALCIVVVIVAGVLLF